VPFVYSTNGEVFWLQDLRDVNSRSRQVAGFQSEIIEINGTLIDEFHVRAL